MRAEQSAVYPPVFLLQGEKEDILLNEKLMLNSLRVDRLPKEASGLQGWIEDLLTQVGPLDRSVDGVLTKAILFYLKNEYQREKSAHDPAQGGLPRFSKHVARALSASSVLATSPDLGAEIQRYVSTNLRAALPVFMGPILAKIGCFCSFKEEHTARHHMMAFLQLKPASMSLRDASDTVHQNP